MTTKPELRLGRTLVPGLLAVALFGLMAMIVLNTSFETMADGFGVDSITAAIGYALFNLGPLQAEAGVAGTEPFLAAFLLIAIVLDAALDASLVLAKREEEGEPVSALANQAADAGTGVAVATGTGNGTPTSSDRPAVTDGRGDGRDDEESTGGETR
ncbi:hypothetical protein [Halobiforma nitratireducens]|uniref:NADH dehydrogenase-like complex subunit J2 n=1 Tax=Halobiforma nitratireducens JCM 10879 TaxID=1227454 RepID=M0M361_9EURY|nr:hypothetical protein [Halobiforma nitratireducens]EMA39848.1 hypothetical protein C446_07999 [Halobiforma nitratireducens JCM 10879]